MVAALSESVRTSSVGGPKLEYTARSVCINLVVDVCDCCHIVGLNQYTLAMDQWLKEL